MNYIIDVKTLNVLNGTYNSQWQAETLRDEYYRSMNPPQPREKAVCKNPILQPIADNPELNRDEKIAAAKVLLELEVQKLKLIKTEMLNANRSKVCVIANSLIKQGMNRSTAFTKSWQTVKAGTVAAKVAGVTFGNRQTALEHLTRYEPTDISIDLNREPTNAYDENAVAVVATVEGKGSYTVGYLARTLAAIVAPLIDYGKSVQSKFLEVRGRYHNFHNYGLLIQLNL